MVSASFFPLRRLYKACKKSPWLYRLFNPFGETKSTLLQKHCNKKQETEECKLKLCGYIYHKGTYTHQAGTEESAGIFTVNRC